MNPLTRSVCSLAFFAVLAFRASCALAYRTAGDLEQFPDTDKVAWRVETIPVELSSPPVGDLDPAQVQTVLRGAFGRWQRTGCGAPDVTFEEVTDIAAAPGDGRNTVQWIREGWADSGYRSDAAAVTDAQYAREQGGSWYIEEADLYLNADTFEWVVGGEPTRDGVRDITSVLVHEVGHILGLLHPCEQEASMSVPTCESEPAFEKTVMYPVYNPERTSLSQDDIDGLCHLYDSVECNRECAASQVCVGGACRDVCDNATCAPDEVCAEGRCITPSRHDTPPPGTVAGEPGDVCNGRSDCSSGECVGGVCAQNCRSETECPEGQACDETSEVCEGAWSLGGFGTPCDAATECVSGRCVAGAGLGSVCTRDCGDKKSECPLGWVCGRADDESVCVPPIAFGASGCEVSVARSGERPAGRTAGGVMLMMIVMAAARHRRAGARSHAPVEAR